MLDGVLGKNGGESVREKGNAKRKYSRKNIHKIYLYYM